MGRGVDRGDELVDLKRQMFSSAMLHISKNVGYSL